MVTRVFAAVLLMIGSRTAAAWVIEPASRELRFIPPLVSPSPSQRIVAQEDQFWKVWGAPEVGGNFEIVGSGVDANGNLYWDVACTPYNSMYLSGYFDVTWCALDGCDEVDHLESVWVDCTPQLAPFDYTFVSAFRNSTSASPFTFTNPSNEPVTVTGFRTSDPQYGVAFASLPVTVAPGGKLDVSLLYHASSATVGILDLITTEHIAARIEVNGLIKSPVWHTVAPFGDVPLGATYTGLVRIHNSTLAPDVIVNASYDRPEFSAAGMVGRMLMPGETTYELVTMNATALGGQTATLTVQFQNAGIETHTIPSSVLPPTFAIKTGDATPTDGWLEFGDVDIASGPVERTVDLVNLGPSVLSIMDCNDYDRYDPPLDYVSPCPIGSIGPGDRAQFTFRLTPHELGHVDKTLPVITSLGWLSMAAHARVVDCTVVACPPMQPEPPPMDGPGEENPGPDPDGETSACNAGGSSSGLVTFALALLLLAARRRRSPSRS